MAKKIINFISNLVIILSIICLIACGISYVKYGEVTLCGYKICRIASASMEPTIMTGDYVLLKLCNTTNEYHINDILVYKNHEKQKLICHRLIDKDENGDYIFKGDNNNYCDNPVKHNNIKYKVVTDFSRPLK